MIDFRYHLVSIIAVFLALAVGLVLGATALSGPALSGLQRLEKTVSRENSALLREKQALANQISADQTFAAAAAPRLLPGLLTGEKVVLVQAPTPDPSIAAGLTTALRQAGAVVTGTVTLNSLFMDTSGANEANLKQLAYRLAGQHGVSLPAELPSPVGAQQAAAKVLAASLLTSGGTGLSAADSHAILTGLSVNGYVTASSNAIAPAELAVLITPGGPPSQSGSAVLVATAVALRNASVSSGTVMVGAVQSIGAPTPISAEDHAGQVSTVDFADTQIGQITTVWALRQLLDDKPPAQYGIGPPPAVPTPAPTPSVTPTLTPTPGTSSSSHPGGHK